MLCNVKNPMFNIVHRQFILGGEVVVEEEDEGEDGEETATKFRSFFDHLVSCPKMFK